MTGKVWLLCLIRATRNSMKQKKYIYIYIWVLQHNLNNKTSKKIFFNISENQIDKAKKKIIYLFIYIFTFNITQMNRPRKRMICLKRIFFNKSFKWINTRENQ